MNTLECIPTTCSSLPHVDIYPKEVKAYVSTKTCPQMSAAAGTALDSEVKGLQGPIHYCREIREQCVRSLWTTWVECQNQSQENTLEGYLYTPITRLQAEITRSGEKCKVRSGVSMGLWQGVDDAPDNLASSHAEPLTVNSLPGLW